jgi:predicted RNA binding protein YcfA (HicA-like mRNA interferase family)
VSTLPRISGREVVAALARVGYAFDRQKGSHIILRNPNPPFRRMTVPDHKEIAKGTLRAIIREAGLTVAQFVALLQ